MNHDSNINTLDWVDDAVVRLIDQTKLPYEFVTVEVKDYRAMIVAIKDMLVRGAPAIGIAGAFGLALGAVEIADLPEDTFFEALKNVSNEIISARPTAVNLEWAVNTLMTLAESLKGTGTTNIVKKIRLKALEMHHEDLQACKMIGKHGAQIVPKGARILTHCNAGGLATVGYGTALGVIRAAYSNDPTIKVYADETRPRQQGARLTAWELKQDNIDTTLVTDGMCGYLFSQGLVDLVVVGADRIAANGDTANKIGTYTVAVAAREHNIPFYVAAPLSTIDPKIPDGSHIPIEQRDGDEVRIINGRLVCPEDMKVLNPSFDVTPARFITGIITEKGILRPNYKEQIAGIFSSVPV